jgi:hypothetical protein
MSGGNQKCRPRCSNPASVSLKHVDELSAVVMLNRIAANLILLSHFLFVLVGVFGALGILVNPSWIWVHIPIVMWSSIVNLAGWTCPLTPLENRFRSAGYGVGYEGGFMHHYIGPIVYPRGMPRKLELVAGLSILLWNALVYGCIYWWFSAA